MREHEAWRRDLAQHGLSAEQLDELEDHLASACERLVSAGAAPDDAAQAARESLGPPASLAREYRKVHSMPQPSRLLAALASIAVVALVAAPAHSTLDLVDAPALFFVCGFLVAGLCASFGVAQSFATLRECLLARNSTALSARERELHLAVVRRGYRLAWVSGALGALAGLIRTLMSLSDPSELGLAAGLGLLSLLYGALLAEVVFANAAQWLAQPLESAAS